VKTMLRNYLSYLSLTAGKDVAKQNLIRSTRINFEDKVSTWWEYDPISRIKLSDLFINIFWIKPLFTPEKKWLDEDGPNKDIITTLRIRYNFSWKDQFWDNYFQPDKKITIGEALYLINTLDSRRDLFAMNTK
jgi:hypothetical protein